MPIYGILIMLLTHWGRGCTIIINMTNAAADDFAVYLDGKLEELTFFTAIPWNSMKVAWGVLWYISFVSWSLSQPVFSARSVAWAEALL